MKNIVVLLLLLTLVLAACTPSSGGTSGAQATTAPASSQGSATAVPTAGSAVTSTTGTTTTTTAATTAVTSTGATTATTGVTTTGATTATTAVTTTGATTATTGGAVAAVPTGKPAQFLFWASGGGQQTFWENMAKAYMAANPAVKMTVNKMPEQPTSESAIQTAIAGGTAPNGSENIFIGFGQDLAASKAIVPLDTMPGWQELITARHMEKTIQAWKFADGHYYVLPIYSNAMLIGWRIDLLKQAGVDTVPRTYTDVLNAGAKLQAKFPDKFIWARAQLAQDTWWERWFDFFEFYDAASNGKPLITGNQITADDQAAVGVLGFFGDLNSKKLLLTQTSTDPFETGLAVMDSIGPWTFPTWHEKYPNLKPNETYTLTLPPVPDNYPANQPIKTFADAKGLVIYAQSTPAQQQAVWNFYRWVYADPQHDLQWFEQTNLPPARDDLSTNPQFKAFFQQHPELVQYANAIPLAVPPLSNGQYQQIQTLLGQQAVNPVVTGQKPAQQAWTDFKNSISSLVK
jgi:multiple sugar transport system substrate-binding protein